MSRHSSWYRLVETLKATSPFMPRSSNCATFTCYARVIRQVCLPKDLSRLQEGVANRLSEYPEKQLTEAKSILESIVETFDRIKKRSGHKDGESKQSGGAGEDGAGEEEDIKDSDPKMSATNTRLRKIRSKYRKAADKVTSNMQSAKTHLKWALYEKKHLTALVEEVSELIEGLEKLFPELLKVEQQKAGEDAKVEE